MAPKTTRPRKKIPSDVKEQVKRHFGDRCAYCQSEKKFILYLEIEHIIPLKQGGTDDESNLCQACRLCNLSKSSHTTAIDPHTEQQAQLFHPRQQDWQEHFRWSSGNPPQIIGTTPTGRATVTALDMNSETLLTARSHWIGGGWRPPYPSRAHLARKVLTALWAMMKNVCKARFQNKRGRRTIAK